MQRVLTLFVRHASFVRKLGESGKLRLTADMTQVRLLCRSYRCSSTLVQLELALAPLQAYSGCKVSELGQAYKAIRYNVKLRELNY